MFDICKKIYFISNSKISEDCEVVVISFWNIRILWELKGCKDFNLVVKWFI